MSAEQSAGLKVVPLSYRVYRLAVVAVFLLAFLIVGLGAAGHGPAGALAGPRRTAATWVAYQMGLNHAYATPEPAPHPTTHKHHKHKHHKHHRHHKHKKGQ
jgi:hypothetical protein